MVCTMRMAQRVPLGSPYRLESLAWIIREDGDSGGDTGASAWYKRCAHKRLATTEALHDT